MAAPPDLVPWTGPLPAGGRLQALRLAPGADLRGALETHGRAAGWPGAFVISAVGSLAPAALRLADAAQAVPRPGPFELLTLSGSVCADGAHLHASLADAEGRVFGGHVSPGCRVHTTVELLLVIVDGPAWRRVHDPATGDPELHVPQG